MVTTPRRTQTPGAKTASKTAEVQTTAPAAADDALDAVLGKQEAPADPPKTAEDVLADILSGDAAGQEDAPEGFIALEQFDAVAADLAETKERLKGLEAKMDLLLSKSGIEAPKKKRWVQGENGLEHKEV